MKKVKQLPIKLAVILLLLTSCFEDPDPTGTTGEVNFSFQSTSKGGRIESNETPDAIFLSIRNEEGELIMDFNRVSLVQVGQDYVTATLELTVGTYTVEDFIVVNEEDSALYMTPKVDSELASLVDTPLPFEFVVQELVTNHLILDVIAANYADALSFGYATFSFNIIDPLLRSLIAWYPLNDNANDSLDINNGVLFGNPSFNQDQYGQPNGAIVLDGIDDYIRVDKSEVVNFDNEDFTIALTFRSDTQNDEGVIFNTRSTSSCSAASGASIGMTMTSAGNLQINARNSANVESYIVSSSIINDGNWHLLSMRRIENSLSLSIDYEVSSITIPEGIDYTTALDFYIGRTIYCSGNYVNAEIGAFKIFDRHLTLEEIHQAF
ncbi:MAG: LamG-like jellyroll fold domain-containing protein [Bacteroidota bacterium]